MKVLVDLSQTIISACTSSLQTRFSEDNPESVNIAKHLAINSLLHLKKRFGGDLILCLDDKSKKYWRKEQFQWYKGHRKHQKEKQKNIDWDFLHKVLDLIIDDLRNHFCYKLVSFPGAEADDVIAVMSKYLQTNEVDDNGIFQIPHDIVIVSTDRDFLQLHKYNNVKQWDNRRKQFITTESWRESLLEKVLTGDTGDNIPNICTPDSWAEARASGLPARANGFKKDRITAFLDENPTLACLNESEKIWYHRNLKLVDFDYIPQTIQDGIINSYQSCKTVGNRTTIMNYFMKNRMRMLLKELNSF